jgi:acetyltransferase
MSKERLHSFFYPQSIAVVGASNDHNKIGGFIFSQILEQGHTEAYPINIKKDHIQGKKAYPNLQAIGKAVDLVIISIPSGFVLQALQDVIDSGAKNVVIITAGFKETGAEGLEKENQIRQLAIENNLNIIGPNCLGILNAETKLNCSFAKDIPQSGGIALISQSGAVIDAIIDWSFKHKVGFSKIVSLGNMAGVDELAMLNYLKEDPKTHSIVFYMETLEKGRLFGETLREVSKHKPVIIIKPGTSDKAKKAIGSHTGSLAQDNVLVKTLIEDNNGILVENLNELFNIMLALKGNYSEHRNLVIVTNAGGPGVIATDAVANTQFELLTFTDEEKKKFYEFLPAVASINNPIDVIGDARSDRYQHTLEELIHHRAAENILIVLTPQIMTDCLNIAKEIVHQSQHSKKNFFTSFLGEKEVHEAIEYLDNSSVPNFQTPSEALFAMEKLRTYKSFLQNKSYPHYKFNEEKIAELKKRLAHRKGLLDYSLTKEILGCFAITLPSKDILKKPEDTRHLKLNPHKNYVLKGDGPKLIHKKELGAVLVGVKAQDVSKEVHALFKRLEKEDPHAMVTVEEQVKGTETVVGLKQDEGLGNFIMFGLGGTYVNLFKEVHFASCPLSRERAEELVHSSKVYNLLKGYRGEKAANFKDLYEVLIRMSVVQEYFPEIKEVDLNPVICNEHGVFLVDVKLIL